MDPIKDSHMTIKAYGAHAGDKPLEPLEITRRAVGAHDVQIDIDYCGVCHSDLHSEMSMSALSSSRPISLKRRHLPLRIGVPREVSIVTLRRG